MPFVSSSSSLSLPPLTGGARLRVDWSLVEEGRTTNGERGVRDDRETER